MKILGYDYKIAKRVDSDTLGWAWGLCHIEFKTLHIASDLPDDMNSEIVVHEILEAVNYHLQLELKHPVIMSLEAALYQALAANGVDLSPLVEDIERKKKG